MNTAVAPQVFLSYASEDLVTVREIYGALRLRGVNVWFDKEHLSTGRWNSQVRRAIAKSRFFLLCLSESCLKKLGDDPGFVDSELMVALEFALEQDERTFSIIPVRLEACERGDHRISIWQQFDLFNNRAQGLDRLAVLLGGQALREVDQSVHPFEGLSGDEQLIQGLLGKSEVLYFANQFKDMLTISIAAEALAKDNARVLHDKGTALLNLNRRDDALDVFRSIAALEPDDFIAWMSISTTASELGRTEEALAANDRALEISPENPIVWSNRAVLFGGRLGRYEDALHAANISLGLEADFLPALAAKGSSLHELRRYADATDTFNQLLDILSKIPDDSREYLNLKGMKADSWFNLGQSLFCDRRPTDALAAYEKALDINASHPGAAQGKLRTLLHVGKQAEAAEFARRFLAGVDETTNR